MEPDTRRSLAGRRLVLGVTGSIAAYKAAELIRLLIKEGADVQPVLTASAERFIPALTLSTLAKRDALTSLFPDVGSDPEAWTQHVELGLWADAVVVAPATAQTIARMAGGMCDDILTAVVLSARCPVLVCPAMDHDMWHHRATSANVDRLRSFGYAILQPAHGELASGLVGEGRLPEPAEIVRWITQQLTSSPRRAEATAEMANPVTRSDLVGKKVLVTAGPTREAIDPVRFLSNGSTGTMGFELAAAAARRGARVVLVTGPVALTSPDGVVRVDVTSAEEMHAAAQAHADADLVIAAAAVADYAPAAPSESKKHKRDDGSDLVMELRRTPDVLAELGARKRSGQVLVGFALETDAGEASARGKLERKHLDFIVLNYANEAGAGFGPSTNRVTVLGADGAREELPAMPKARLADVLLDRVSAGVAS